MSTFLRGMIMTQEEELWVTLLGNQQGTHPFAAMGYAVLSGHLLLGNHKGNPPILGVHFFEKKTTTPIVWGPTV